MKILRVTNIGLANYGATVTYHLVAIVAASVLLCLHSRIDSAMLLVLSGYD
jgi:hypothetical protein